MLSDMVSFFLLFMVLRIEPRVLCMLGKSPTTKLYLVQWVLPFPQKNHWEISSGL